MTLKLRHDSSGYLTCEHVSVFYLLMLNSGIMGAYAAVFSVMHRRQTF